MTQHRITWIYSLCHHLTVCVTKCHDGIMIALLIPLVSLSVFPCVWSCMFFSLLCVCLSVSWWAWLSACRLQPGGNHQQQQILAPFKSVVFPVSLACAANPSLCSFVAVRLICLLKPSHLPARLPTPVTVKVTERGCGQYLGLLTDKLLHIHNVRDTSYICNLSYCDILMTNHMFS